MSKICICTLCGEPGHNRRTCLDRFTNIKPQDRKKRWADKMRESGRCITCGASRAAISAVYCSKHLDMRRVGDMRRRSARRRAL